MIDIRIQSADFDPGRQLARLAELHSKAVASFTGLLVGEDVSEILVEHHAALAKSELNAIAEEARERWALTGVILIHRHGRFKNDDRVLFAAAAADDPAAATQGCAFLVEALGNRAPFWRKDLFADGTARWF